MKFLIVLLALIGAAVAQSKKEDTATNTNTLWNSTDVERLKKELFTNYDPTTRPANYDDTIYLKIGVTVVHVELDESNSLLSTHSWLHLTWEDSKLKWDPADFNNITVLRIPEKEVWKPDVTSYNSGGLALIHERGHTLAYNSGTVLWVPKTKIETYCDLDLTHWPFDTQVCMVKMGSWVFDAFKMNFTEAKSQTEFMMANAKWKILDLKTQINTKYYECCPEPYSDFTFTLTMQRRQTVMALAVYLPGLLIMFLVLTSFWLPPKSTNKFMLQGFGGVIGCAMLVFLAVQLPTLSYPSVAIFYVFSTFLVLISIVVSTITINLAERDKNVKWIDMIAFAVFFLIFVFIMIRTC